MGLPLFQEKRFAPRRRLTGLLPGKLIFVEDGAEFKCRPIDISRDGLGIISEIQVSPDTKVVLIVGDQKVKLNVTWGQPDFGKRDRFRYGLMVLEPGTNLLDIFEQKGCLQ